MAVITKYLSMYKLNDENTLLLNALSGAIDIVDNETKDKILTIQKTNSTKETDEELVNTLVRRGYLFDSEEAEMDFLFKQRQVYNSITGKKISFVICPTMACNLRCTYCFESEEARSNTKIMTDEQIENIFKHIKNILLDRKPRYAVIELFGGEPLLPSTESINEKIFEFAQKNEMEVTVISNGTHIITYKDLIMKYKDILNFQITIDGIREIHDKRRVRADKTGTFDIVCEGIDTLLDIGVRTNIRVNVDRENIDTLREFIEFVKDRGWDRKNEIFHCDIAPVTNHHASNNLYNLLPEHQIVKKALEQFPDYDPSNSFFELALFRVLGHLNKTLNINWKAESYYNFHYCEANVLQFYVFTPDGFIYACPEAIGDSGLSIGRFDEEIELIPEKVEAWKGRDIFRIPRCRECKIAPFCGGGCAFAAIKANGDMDLPVCDDAENVLAQYIDSIKDYIIMKYC